MNKVLCVIDIQNEYISPGRSFYINGIEPSLACAKQALNIARNEGWQIVHIKHLQAGSAIFNPDNSFSEFISGFEPKANEHCFIKNNFSSFSSSEFTNYLEQYKNSEIYVIGYGTTMCCLSTIIDGYHRGFKIKYVSDASYAKPTTTFSSEQLHSTTTEVLKSFCEVIQTIDLKSN